jgi:Uma2 family endonuclease
MRKEKIPMATAVHIPIEQYLRTAYRPDCEYVDGEVLERNVGKWEHARVQWLLAAWFANHEQEWGVVGSTEQRLQVAPNRVRVPDLVVASAGPQPPILAHPPLLIVEILSPDDTFADIDDRARDYFAMGVAMLWIVDPRARSGRMCRPGSWREAGRLEVPGTPIHVELADIFARLSSL